MLMSPSLKLAGTKRTLFLAHFPFVASKTAKESRKIIILLRSSSTCVCGGLHDFVPEFEAVQLRNGSMEKLSFNIFCRAILQYLNHGNRFRQKILCHFFCEVYTIFKCVQMACRNAATAELMDVSGL